MKIVKIALLVALSITGSYSQTKPPLLPEPVIAALANELSGETAKRNLEFISRQHRMRASRTLSAAQHSNPRRGKSVRSRASG